MPGACRSSDGTGAMSSLDPTAAWRGIRGAAGVVRGVTGRVKAVATGTVDVVGEAARALFTPTGLVGAATEALWVGTHLAIYPLGLVEATRGGATYSQGYSIEHLPPVQRGLVISNVEAAGTPILLVHGMADNRSIFTLLRIGLRRRGFGRVATMNYSILTGDIRVAAVRLAEEVDRIVAETGYERIHVVGHSMGGLIARYYVTRLGGDKHVHTLVTLGTPHQGTYNAYVAENSLTRQLRPGSPFMQELQQPIRTCQTRFLCYWSDLDEMIFPQRFAVMEHPDLNVTNVAMHAVGHMSLPIMNSVVHGISTALAHLDSDGSTVTPGVLPIGGRTRRGGVRA